MKRRRLLVGAGACIALGGCLSSARDESGPRRPPAEPEGGRGLDEGQRELIIRDANVEENDDGQLSIVVTVENTSGVEQSDTLVGVATVDGDEHRVSQDVTLDANDEETYTLVFDLDYETWSANGNLSYGWDDEVE